MNLSKPHFLPWSVSLGAVLRLGDAIVLGRHSVAHDTTHRPQSHFSSEKNWRNDPNGLVHCTENIILLPVQRLRRSLVNTAAARPDPSLYPRALLSRLRPDAFVSANDYTAAQWMTTLSSLEVSVPSQLRIVGIDHVKYARLLQVPLTTIYQQCLDIGTTALLAMQDRLERPNAPARDFLLDFRLVVRQSSGITVNVAPDVDALH